MCELTNYVLRVITANAIMPLCVENQNWMKNVLFANNFFSAQDTLKNCIERVWEIDPSAHFDTSLDALSRTVTEMREIPEIVLCQSFERVLQPQNDVIAK